MSQKLFVSARILGHINLVCNTILEIVLKLSIVTICNANNRGYSTEICIITAMFGRKNSNSFFH